MGSWVHQLSKSWHCQCLEGCLHVRPILVHPSDVFANFSGGLHELVSGLPRIYVIVDVPGQFFAPSLKLGDPRCLISLLATSCTLAMMLALALAHTGLVW
jgi:hypothetical protein